MKLQYKILSFFLLTLAGFLFLNTDFAAAGRCECCYSRIGEAATESACSSMCRDFGDWKYFASGDPATTGRTNSTACLPPEGMCFCCWADAPESGTMLQAACIGACTDKGSVKSFRSTVTSLNLTRDCLPRPVDAIGCTGDADCPTGQVCGDIEDGVGFCSSPSEPTSGETSNPELDAPTGVLSGGLQKAAGKAGFQSTSVENIVSNIVYVILSFVGVIFLALTIYAGFIWMTAGGNTEDVEKAKKILERAAVGLVVVLAAYAITYFVTTQIITP